MFALGIGGVVYIAVGLAAIVRRQGVVASVKEVGGLAGLCAAGFLLYGLSSAVKPAMTAASGDFRSFVSKLTELLAVALALGYGAVLHARWVAGDDILSSLIMLALLFTFGLFCTDGKR